MSQVELGRAAGVSQQTIGKIEKGDTENSRHLPRILLALGLPLDILADEAPGLYKQTTMLVRPAGPLPPTLQYKHDNRGVDTTLVRLFPLHTTSHEQIWIADDQMGFLRRIEPLWDSAGAYALYVADDTAAPAIGAGDVILVNPDLPPLPGTDCVFIRKMPDGAKPWLVEVRRLSSIDMDAQAWVVDQFNPPRRYSLKRDEFSEAHRIVAVYRRP